MVTVSFEKKVILKKNTKYDIRAMISGPPSQYGAGEVSVVICSGVTFTFMNSEYSTNLTDVIRNKIVVTDLTKNFL